MRYPFGGFFSPVDYKSEEVLLYTGNNDINDRPIFENDLIIDYRGTEYTIAFFDGCFYLLVNGLDEDPWLIASQETIDHREMMVIGNTFEGIFEL